MFLVVFAQPLLVLFVHTIHGGNALFHGGREAHQIGGHLEDTVVMFRVIVNQLGSVWRWNIDTGRIGATAVSDLCSRDGCL